MKQMTRCVLLALSLVATLSLAACGNFLGVPKAASNIFTLTIFLSRVMDGKEDV